MKKDEIIDAILALNPDEGLEGKTVAELEPILKALKAEADAAKEFHVAEGKSLTTKRGILGPGAQITAGDFSGDGGKILASFVESGHVK